MKRLISLVLTLSAALCCLCFSGCQQTKNNPTPNDLVNALKSGGYPDAYINSTVKNYVQADYVEVVGSEGDIYICATRASKDAPIKDAVEICNYSSDKNQKDMIKILDIIMPLFDDEYNNNGETIINELETLSKDRSNLSKRQFLDYDPTYYSSYELNSFVYNKEMNENYEDECISINGKRIFEVYLQRNNITEEEYYQQESN